MFEERWKQRFENYEKAYGKFNKALDAYLDDKQNEIIQMAVIQSFEFTYELGWKTIKDYLNHGGISVNMPREVIKEGFSNNIIEDGDAWVNMLNSEELIMECYLSENANEIVNKIVNDFKPEIEKLYLFFKASQSL